MNRVDRVRKAFEGESEPGLFSPNYVSHAPWDRLVQKRAKGATEAGRAMFRAKKVFADCAVSMDDAAEDGDQVVVRWSLRGTWTHPMPGIAIKPTGRTIQVAGISIYQFKGDQIVAKYGEFDVAAFHAQACANVRAEECVENLAILGSARA
jgi:predicted ester cyclase